MHPFTLGLSATRQSPEIAVFCGILCINHATALSAKAINRFGGIKVNVSTNANINTNTIEMSFLFLISFFPPCLLNRMRG